MTNDRILPTSPMKYVRERLTSGRVTWSYHSLMRLRSRAIMRRQVIEAVAEGEVVEEYPEDKYLPSYLVLCLAGDGPFHMVVGVDVPGDSVRVVTVYRPDPRELEPDHRTRR